MIEDWQLVFLHESELALRKALMALDESERNTVISGIVARLEGLRPRKRDAFGRKLPRPKIEENAWPGVK